MWANAQPDGRPAEYRWRLVLDARKVWLAATARLPCSNAANRRAQDLKDAKWILHLAKFRYGATAAESVHNSLPAKHCAKIWLASVERRRCSNEAKTRKPLKLAGMP